jgi:hypothetical protein
MNEYKAYFDNNLRKGLNVYLVREENGQLFTHTIENENLVRHPHTAGDEYKSLLYLPAPFNKNILTAIAEGLADIGIVAEVDNKQRIVAEALAHERKEEVEYYKKQSEKIIDYFLRKE